MTLTDAGPLIALVDAQDPANGRCRDVLDLLRLPLLTTYSAFTEAMHLLGRAGGWYAQEGLWRLVHSERLALATPSPSADRRAAELMEQYADQPMDIADATLVALAEERDETRIFTLDGDFQNYRLKGRRHLEIIPE